MLEPVLLEGPTVRLEPLHPRHADDLARAAGDGDVWRKWTTRIPAPDEVPAEIEARLAAQAAGRIVAWAVVTGGRAVGMTTYWAVDEGNRRLEIGATWLGASAQGTGTNAEAKLLLLTRAFEVLGCIAVEFRTHWHNRQSREAIERLGAKLDGVLRNHSIGREGTLRDTVVYSIIASEWPTVRLGLLERLRARHQ
ncbi:GNAT family protein [Amnibacterium sp.]|uniref:GNAT family N-acetyltransferase n=1 Tax=Amnibacterium sp. TaxID=1872496 RepID=UPI00261EBB89|nr:GNAT family protein [Amnibacterium sp.]MCU1472347.1 N-acetyltransferase [Amnibacterium sp.]